MSNLELIKGLGIQIARVGDRITELTDEIIKSGCSGCSNEVYTEILTNEVYNAQLLIIELSNNSADLCGVNQDGDSAFSDGELTDNIEEKK